MINKATLLNERRVLLDTLSALFKQIAAISQQINTWSPVFEVGDWIVCTVGPLETYGAMQITKIYKDSSQSILLETDHPEGPLAFYESWVRPATAAEIEAATLKRNA